MQTEFLLQFWKKRENSTILLASSKRQKQGQEEKTKN
jgi:hypothetical protein